MTLENNRAPLLSNIKLYASFHDHMWGQIGVTVQKCLSWVLTSLTLTFDLWPWLFAWTSLLSLVITPENFMIRWWEHSEKCVTDRQTDRQTDGQTDWTIYRAAWSQLKILPLPANFNTNNRKFSKQYICHSWKRWWHISNKSLQKLSGVTYYAFMSLWWVSPFGHSVYVVIKPSH